jgi:sugar phosphate isomerase/epimerase
MILTGLVSVTFRKFEPAKIVELVCQAGLQAIEWGGDVHVPHGDIQRAKDVLRMTREAGLQVSSYGSYYKVGCGTGDAPFEKVLETAEALQVPTIRVWAGDLGSDLADADWWRKVIEDSRRIAALSAGSGINIAFEYHEETLTDSSVSACRLLNEIDRSNVRGYWQPPVGLSLEERLNGLRELAPWLSNLHVYNPSGGQPGPLADGVAEWSKYMEIVRNLPGDRFCLLEFVMDGSPHQFFADAKALKIICG